MKSIMIALLRIAIDEEIIAENPMNGIYIKAKFRAVRKKSDGSKLYLNDDFGALDTFLEEESTIEALCIQLMFQLGVRIGEGVALKFSDIEYGKIAIQRMEEKVLVFDGENFKSAGVQIVEHLKKENDSEYRFILLTDVAKEIIRKAKELNPDGEFIFERNGERLTARAVTYWLSKYCRDAGITYKSPHCTRRTTASRLGMEGMPLDKIREILGQVDERTTLSYIYNPNTEQGNLDIMNKSLNSSNKKNKKN
ncbi:tyrosine-type recombinase/integrase [Anaerocolumna sp. MB42-C2]|uniref:tyrosine-type recombinase/integrase n=1 Tax=Anaerocolumna sp. MB42-C2 TaxID=3070997 RepID=UPI0027E0177A|nr:tyrosine-type recombinase/integrase [Anaerocolumna sp. MB42-C2]WMJ87397.1 tyrosine-type recombinase/integrase [Anaerocolumna sp. MB42-C2]